MYWSANIHPWLLFVQALITCVGVSVIWGPTYWLCFYQTRSAWSMDQGSTRKGSVVHNFAPTVTKFCVMWEGLSLPHDTKFGKCRGEIVDRRMISIWPLIEGSGWSGLIKAEPGPPFTKRTDVLLYDLVKSRSHKIECRDAYNVLKFDRHLSSTAAKVPAEFQSNWKSLKLKLVVSRPHETLQ